MSRESRLDQAPCHPSGRPSARSQHVTTPGRRHERVVVITGASSGIGRATALALASRGDHVVLAARSTGSLMEVAAECERHGGRALVAPTDVTDESSVRELAAAAVDTFGRIDAWLNVAAVWTYGRFEDTPPLAFRQVVETTLFGQVHGARAALAEFRRQGHGVLVNVSSLYGRTTAPYVSAYVAAKHALVGFTDVLRHEFADHPHIHVSMVLPGSVDTPIYRHAGNYVGREIRPLPPVVSPERVAAATVRAMDRPRRHVVVGRTHHAMSWAHRLVPNVYDRLVVPAIHLGVLRDVASERHDGNVFEPDATSNAVDGGWRRHDHRVVGTAAGAIGIAGAMASLLVRARMRRQRSGHVGLGR